MKVCYTHPTGFWVKITTTTDGKYLPIVESNDENLRQGTIDNLNTYRKSFALKHDLAQGPELYGELFVEEEPKVWSVLVNHPKFLTDFYNVDFANMGYDVQILEE